MESHCGDKTVVRLSYLHNGISYTGIESGPDEVYQMKFM